MEFGLFSQHHRHARSVPDAYEEDLFEVVAAKTVDEAIGMLKAGTAQAFALTHDALPPLQKMLPGSRILDGAFQTTGVGLALLDARSRLAHLGKLLPGGFGSTAPPVELVGQKWDDQKQRFVRTAVRASEADIDVKYDALLANRRTLDDPEIVSVHAGESVVRPLSRPSRGAWTG